MPQGRRNGNVPLWRNAKMTDYYFDQLCRLARARAESYWWLSNLYFELPTPEKVRALREKLDALADNTPDALTSHLLTLRSLFQGRGDDEIADRLLPEQTRLFGGLHPAYGPPPPYESVYRGAQFMGEVTLSVIRAFHDAGFEQIETSVGPADHIVSELKFMAALCFREQEAWERGESDRALQWVLQEKRFLDDHIMKWIPAFCDALKKSAKERYFVCLADLTLEACESDTDAVGHLLHRRGSGT